MKNFFCGVFALLGVSSVFVSSTFVSSAFASSELSSSNSADVEELIRSHNGKIEELSHRIDRIEKKLGISPDDFSSKSPEQAAADIKGKSPQNVIETARSLIKQDKYQNARNNLSAFIKANPKSPYCGTMNFYIGKSYFEEKKYQDAAKFFMESFEANQNGKKTAKALYKLAECFMKLGKNDQMKMTLEKLAATFPGTKYGKKASAWLGKLKKS